MQVPRFKVSLLFAFLNLQLVVPALAQTAMLEGSATYTDINPPPPLQTTVVQTQMPVPAPMPVQVPIPGNSLYGSASSSSRRPSVRVKTPAKPRTVYLKDQRSF